MKISRGGFLSYIWRLFSAAGVLPFLFPRRGNAATTLQPRSGTRRPSRASVITGNDAGRNVRSAIESIGGISSFISPGDTVVIKPNIGWTRKPAFAATTDPDVVATLVKIAIDAKASTVKVFDYPCTDPQMAYTQSGIEKAAKSAGARVLYTPEWKFVSGNFPATSPMKDWPIFRDAVECDCFINVPVAKHHSLTDLTLSIKNLMGVCGKNRGKMHWNINESLADLLAFMKPDLTVIDMTRVLLRNGPSGGDLADVEQQNTIIASTDPVLADSLAARAMGRNPGEIKHIRLAAAKGLGSMDTSSPDIIRKKA